MSNLLANSTAYKLDEIAAAKAALPFAEVEQAAKAADAPRGFLRALETKRDAGQAALIAEIKKSSPSKGWRLHHRLHSSQHD